MVSCKFNKDETHNDIIKILLEQNRTLIDYNKNLTDSLSFNTLATKKLAKNTSHINKNFNKIRSLKK
jgi:hypothetical protein